MKAIVKVTGKDDTVVAMFASAGENLVDNPDVIYKLLVSVLYIIGY
ncbi:hypothetical protein ABE545_19565 [Sphingobacterium faecium]